MNPDRNNLSPNSPKCLPASETETGRQRKTKNYKINMDTRLGLLKRFFKKKEVKFLGRAGMVLHYQNIDYFIDSEMSLSKDTDIVIFKDSIRINGTKESLVESKKKEVLNYLLDYLAKKEKLRIELFPK